MLQAWITLGWEFEHSETSVDHWLEETRMTRLLALSRTLSPVTLSQNRLWEVSGESSVLRTVPTSSLAVEINQTMLKWLLVNLEPLERCDVFYVRRDGRAEGVTAQNCRLISTYTVSGCK